jgi:TPR repeat protein
MPKPVGRCTICGENGPLGEPCAGAMCLGAGCFFEPIDGKDGNIEAQAVAREVQRREEAEAQKLEEALEADVRALTGEVDVLHVDASQPSWSTWLKTPWMWVTAVSVVLVALLVGVWGEPASEQGGKRVKTERKLSKDTKLLQSHIMACDGGDLARCDKAALALKQGIGAQPSPIQAREFMGKACEGGRGEACDTLANWLESETQDGNPEQVHALYRSACKRGIASACAEVARRVRDQGQRMSEARAMAKKACDAGAPRGCYLLASMCERGEGGPRSEEMAEFLFGSACDAKVGDACNDLAVMLHERDGKPDKIQRLYLRACEHRSGTGCFSMGMLHEQGESANPSQVQAVKFYIAACDLSHGEACYRLAQAYLNGKGVSADAYRSREYMRRACQAGYTQACR